MKLGSLDTPAVIELAASWLARRENYQWFDFSNGQQIVTPTLLKLMTQRNTHELRVYTGDGDAPIGIVGLYNIDRTFGTATLWGVTGEKSFRNRGYATFAASKFLTFAFRELRLRAVNTWIVEHNPSARVLARLNFSYVGRQRQCHCIGGRIYDRLIFDLLASEHREIEDGPWSQPQRRTERSAAGDRSKNALRTRNPCQRP
jgi:RimJ/RimL family protein N-acetyltransferase